MWLQTIISPTQEIDLPIGQWKSTQGLFHAARPDIVILSSSEVKIIELTICHESNLNSSKQYKLNKYHNLNACLTEQTRGKSIAYHTIEVTTLGFISPDEDLSRTLGIPKIPKAIKESIIKSVLNCSFKIYCNRNNIG